MKRLLPLICAIAGCGGLGAGSHPDMGADIDYVAESAASAPHGATPTTLANAKGVTSLFVQEDPTLDPNGTAGANADAVAAQLTGAVASCVNPSITHTAGSVTVTIDFGAACVIPKVGAVSGMVAATVSKTAGAIDVAFTFTNLVVNGQTMTGSIALSTTTGTSFTIMFNLQTATQTVMFNGTAALDSGGGGVTFNGTGSSQLTGASPQTFSASGLHHLFGGCYADAGTMSLSKTTTDLRNRTVTLTETITFDSSTPATGMVQIDIDGVTTPETLPAHGTCPHA